MDRQGWLRKIPKVDQLLKEDRIVKMEAHYGYDCVREAVRC